MKVLIGCEESQVVCKAFREEGHEAYSCDLQPCSGGRPEWHLQMDVFEGMASKKWDLAIFHPPCTFLANSGVRWLYERPGRWDRMKEAAIFFRRCLFGDALDIPMIAVENPVLHLYAKQEIGFEPNQIIQPWYFGHGETKKTCLWLRNLPPLMSTIFHPKREGRIHKMSPGPERSKLRSKAYPGIAKAMAQQWGNLK